MPVAVQALEHLVEEPDGAGLQERRRTGAQHLGGCQLSGDPLVRRSVCGVERTQPAEHVLLERRVVRDVAACQRLTGDVDVRVDQARSDDEALAAESTVGDVSRVDLGVGPTATIDAVAQRHRAVVDDVPARVHRHHVPTVDDRVDALGRIAH